jgi:hypothetical protein
MVIRVIEEGRQSSTPAIECVKSAGYLFSPYARCCTAPLAAPEAMAKDSEELAAPLADAAAPLLLELELAPLPPAFRRLPGGIMSGLL